MEPRRNWQKYVHRFVFLTGNGQNFEKQYKIIVVDNTLSSTHQKIKTVMVLSIKCTQ